VRRRGPARRGDVGVAQGVYGHLACHSTGSNVTGTDSSIEY
jgi:hypothetical protein